MVWHNISVNNHNLKITNLKVDSQDYPSVDKDGKELEKHYIDANGNRTSNAYNSYKWIRKEDSQEVPKAYKLINNKVVDKLKKTKDIKAEEVEASETNDLMTEDYYLVEADAGFNLPKDKALKFIYSNGNGFKAYRSFIKEINGRYVMVCGRGFMSKQIEKVGQPSNAKSKAKELFDEGISQADMNDLIEA